MLFKVNWTCDLGLSDKSSDASLTHHSCLSSSHPLPSLVHNHYNTCSQSSLSHIRDLQPSCTLPCLHSFTTESFERFKQRKSMNRCMFHKRHLEKLVSIRFNKVPLFYALIVPQVYLFKISGTTTPRSLKPLSSPSKSLALFTIWPLQDSLTKIT